MTAETTAGSSGLCADIELASARHSKHGTPAYLFISLRDHRNAVITRNVKVNPTPFSVFFFFFHTHSFAISSSMMLVFPAADRFPAPLPPLPLPAPAPVMARHQPVVVVVDVSRERRISVHWVRVQPFVRRRRSIEVTSVRHRLRPRRGRMANRALAPTR